jgi:hypothetical protein
MHDLTRPVGRYLLDLERRVIAAGFPWRWHERPPKWWLESQRGQQFLFDMNQYAAPGPMCQGCEDQAARLMPTPDDVPCHKIARVGTGGRISPLCAGKPRQINLRFESATSDWSAVTCEKCLAMKPKGDAA